MCRRESELFSNRNVPKLRLINLAPSTNHRVPSIPKHVCVSDEYTQKFFFDFRDHFFSIIFSWFLRFFGYCTDTFTPCPCQKVSPCFKKECSRSYLGIRTKNTASPPPLKMRDNRRPHDSMLLFCVYTYLCNLYASLKNEKQ